MRALHRILTLHCAESCRLQSQKLDDGSLCFVDRIAYAGHLLACRSCRRLHRQFEILERAVIRLREPPPQRMPTETKKRLAIEIERFFDSRSEN